MAIKLAASSTLKLNSIATSSVNANQHTNTGVTATDAPVLLTVQANDIIDASTFANMVATSNADLTNAFVARVLNALNETVADIVADATLAPTIDLGWGKFVFEIAGSLATATATPTTANYCYFSGQVAQKYQRQFAQMSAYVATALNPCDLKRIVDAETSDLNVIYAAGRTFYADGRGLTFGTTGDKQELYKLDGTKLCDLVLDSTKSYSNSLALKVPTTVSIPAGTHIVKITCAIDGTSYPMEKKVSVPVAIVPTPAITSAKQGTRTDGKMGFGQGAANAITLTGLFPGGKKTGDALMLYLLNSSGEVLAQSEATEFITASTETSLTLGNGVDNNSAKPDSDWQNQPAKIAFKRDGEEYSYSFTFLNA